MFSREKYAKVTNVDIKGHEKTDALTQTLGQEEWRY